MGKIYCYANFFCYANLSIVSGPNFRGANCFRGTAPLWKKASLRGLTAQNLRNETLAIADHLYVKISKLALSNIKLLLKEENILHMVNE